MIKNQVKKKGLFKNYSVKEKRKFPFVYLIIALPVIQIAVFFFYVNFSSFMLAFQDEYGRWSFESIRRVVQAFVDKNDRLGYNPLEMFGKSLTIWGLMHVVGFAVSIFTSYILTKHMALSKCFRLLYQIPGLVGAVVFSTVMKEMYAYNGIVTTVIKGLGIKLPPLAARNGLLGATETAFPTLMVQVFILTIAGGNLIIASAYKKIPEEIFESAQLEGVGFFREVFQIAVPCIWPTISTVTIFALCSVFTADYSMYLYSNGSGVSGMTSIGFYLYRYQVSISTAADKTYLYGYVSAFGMLVTLMTLPVVLFGRWLLTHKQDDVGF